MKTVVLGGGESGVGAALLAKIKGHQVFVSDKGQINDLYKEELTNNGIPYEEGRHSWDRIDDAELVVKSPGIPDKVPIVVSLVEKNIPVISEIEFASRYTNAKIIGITGSNGKTTTTKLLYHLLKNGELDVVMAGNVGDSFARSLVQEEHQVYVLELSSFQLDGIQQFRPDISILLNITPDHLDRYEYKMENYIRSKFRIVMNQTNDDLFLYNGEDENIRNFLTNKELVVATSIIDYQMIEGEKIKVEGEWYDLESGLLRGKHNYMNALFAVSVARKLGLSRARIQEGLDSFQSVEHRLELVAEIEGVEYINDSKATNVDSVYYALEAMNRPVVWIVGGQDKGNDYQPLLELVKSKVKAIVCLGIDNKKLLDFFSPWVENIQESGSAAEAVALATKLSSKGDVVLLSPACASFDLFRNYEDRGNQFKNEVKKLVSQK